jgi:4-amino-4-deoxy-L-arabinose transferase-like glycosyltransferase
MGRMLKKIAFPLLLILVSSIYFFTAKDIAILDDGDALYAHVASQMLHSGNWVTPYADGVRFLDKPPMMYWSMAVAYKLFGQNEFAARFPSALAVLGISILIFLMGKKAGGESTGFVAGIAAAFCLGTFLFTRMVFPDILFVFFLTFALFCFLIWHFNERNPLLPALLFYVALAAAVLTKGMIGLVFPCAIIFLFLLWSGTLSRLRHFHIPAGIPIFLGLAAPWHIMAARSNSGFLWYFFVNEQALRFIGRRQPADYESIPLLIFWPLILVWLFPWSVFLPAIKTVIQGHKYDAGSRTIVRMSASWAAVILVFFSLSSRIEHYSLPLLPPLALLIGIAISPLKMGEFPQEQKRQRWVSRGFLWLGILGIILGAVLIAIGIAWILGFIRSGSGGPKDLTHLRAYKYYFAPLFDFPPHLLAQLKMPLLQTIAALSLGLPLAWQLNRRRRRIGAVLAISGAMMVFFFSAFQSLGVCQEILSSRQFGQKLLEIYSPGDCVVTVGDFETANSINFYAPTPLYVYDGSAALLQWGLRYPDAPDRVLTREKLEALWNGLHRMFVLAPEDRLNVMRLSRYHLVMRASGRVLLCNKAIEAR